MSAALERRYGLVLGAVLAAGLLARLAAAAHYPPSFDMANFERSVTALLEHGLDFYAHATSGPIAGFPYPPAYLAWLVAADAVGWDYDFVVRLAPVTADIALAWLVQRVLRDAGAAPAVSLSGAALVTFGPQVLTTSAAGGQFDSVAVLPAVVAALVWRRDVARRAVLAGVLIGFGAALKTVPLLMVAALLPTARSGREAVQLIALALAVPLAALAPFLAADPGAVVSALRYHGYPGGGGLNIVLQPGLANYGDEELGPVVELLQHLNAPLVLLISGGLAALLRRRRVEPIRAAAILWLGVFVAGVNWYPQYLLWALPFFLMAGWIAWVAVLEVVLLPFCLDYVPELLAPLAEPFTRRQATLLVMASAVAWLIWAARLASAGSRVLRNAPA